MYSSLDSILTRRVSIVHTAKNESFFWLGKVTNALRGEMHFLWKISPLKPKSTADEFGTSEVEEDGLDKDHDDDNENQKWSLFSQF